MATLSPEHKLPSLTIFFPFRNDEKTVFKTLDEAFFWGNQLTDDLEVIAIIGGKSIDKTSEKIWEYQNKHPKLIVLDHQDNRIGYAVIKHGLGYASKEFVFYTDGDRQYHLNELRSLVAVQIATGADVVNGYKLGRGEGFIRELPGSIHAWLAKKFLRLPIRDVHCDFRLIRKDFLCKFQLHESGASILSELIIKLDRSGAKFQEIGVRHFGREYGKSNYSLLKLTSESIWEIVRGIKLRYF